MEYLSGRAQDFIGWLESIANLHDSLPLGMLDTALVTGLPSLGAYVYSNHLNTKIAHERLLVFGRGDFRVKNRYSDYCKGLNYATSSIPLLCTALILYYNLFESMRWGVIFALCAFLFVTVFWCQRVATTLDNVSGRLDILAKARIVLSNWLGFILFALMIFINCTLAVSHYNESLSDNTSESAAFTHYD